MTRRVLLIGALVLTLVVSWYEVTFGGRSSAVESIGIAVAGLIEAALIGGVVWLILRVARGATKSPEPLTFMLGFAATFVVLLAVIDSV